MYTRQLYPGVTSTGPFAIGIPYLVGEQIKTYLVDSDGETNKVPVSFEFEGTPSVNQPAGTSVRLTNVPNGRTLLIENSIDLDTLFVNWNKSAALNNSNLRNTSRDLLEKIWLLSDRYQTVEDLALQVLIEINNILPEQVIVAAAQIQADRIAAQQAAAGAEAAKINLGRYIDLDFGTATRYKEFAIPVAFDEDLVAGTQVRLQQIGLGVGRDNDENSMDYIVANAVVTADNQLTVYAKSLDGSVSGLYRFAVIF